ncbi:MAG: hypothetical protein ISR68_00065 [Campylobacterales bacterium]|nr:hypothetical protein [Campylobacterales bacterium]
MLDKSKDEAIQAYLDALKKKDKPEKKEPQSTRIRDILFPSISQIDKRKLAIVLSAIFIIAILLIIFIDTDSATPNFDSYHEEHKYLQKRTDIFDDGEELKDTAPPAE